MRIIDHIELKELRPAKVQFFRIDPEDLHITLNDILYNLMDRSWLSKFDQDYEKSAFSSRAQKTIDDIKKKFESCIDDNITKEAGEYVVSELARETLVTKLDYLNIPLAELLGKKRTGNAGFDFHSQNQGTNTIIFGEAKYSSSTTAYAASLSQIIEFIEDNKDIEDLPDLKNFCTLEALQRAHKNKKGFSAAFSARSTKTKTIVNNIIKRSEFQDLLQYEEIILVAVNL